MQPSSTPSQSAADPAVGALQYAVAPAPHVMALDESGQFELFAHDVKAAAIALAKLMSCYNGAALSSAFRLPAHLDICLPEYPSSFKFLVGGPFIQRLSAATRSGLKGFTFYLGRAREEALLLIQAPGPGAPVSSAELAPAIEVTSAAACFAKLAINDLLMMTRREGREFEVAQLSYLVVLLDDCLEGRSPLWADGKILKVREDFRLRERRVEMSAVAVIVGEAREEQVIITNISRGGLGFQGTATFAPSQWIEISLLEPPRRFSGQVAWRRGLNVGVRFDDVLALNDPLLSVLDFPHEDGMAS